MAGRAAEPEAVMYPATARFLATLAESYTPVSRVTLFRTDGRVEQLDHTAGTVTVDRGQQWRRACSVSHADPALIPRTEADKLSVYGAQLRIEAGVQLGSYVETVPVGQFRIETIDGDVDDGPAVIVGQSLECIVIDDAFTAPWRATGTAVGAITALILRSLPDAAVVALATDAAIGPRTFDIGDNPWEAIGEIAATIGAEVYCDAAGTFVIAELPDLLTVTPAWTIAAGEHGVYLSASRGMASKDVKNGVLVRGENPETGVATAPVLVVDSDPGSPTYWGGPFGRRPRFHTSPTLTTTGACTAAGTLLLRAAMAPNSTANLRALVNPALEPGDVLRVVYPDSTADLVQAASFAIDLGVGGDFLVQAISAKEGA
ncbi:tail protein [Streptomyces phage VWB]|uniref:DUF5047 domain-containing protein n=1 Tax=Streptomyces phage VWB TaxID=10702 RepID=Q6VY40_9CAUD|nr:tail protein [Streptomyces phage VWB]AAR29737.1 hypothetical protein [Streptomyces phage VWB]